MGVGTRKRRDPTSTLGSLGHPKPKAELWGCTLLHRFPVSSSFTSLLPPPSTLAREQTTFQPTHPEHPPQGLLSLGFFALKNPLLLILSLPTKCRGPPPTNRCVCVCGGGGLGGCYQCKGTESLLWPARTLYFIPFNPMRSCDYAHFIGAGGEGGTT